jgi:hypothetical protein
VRSDPERHSPSTHEPEPQDGFANTFTVETNDARATGLLEGPVARHLLQLHRRRGPVELGAEWLWVRVASLPLAPAQALDLMEEVAEAGHGIALAARSLTSGGTAPYRARQ